MRILSILALIAAILAVPAPQAEAEPSDPVLCWIAPPPTSGWTAVGRDYDRCADCETAGQAGLTRGDWDRYLCGWFPIGLDGVYKLYIRADGTRSQFSCTFYLMTQGYSGKIVDIGCADGARGNEVLCRGSLRIAGVPAAIAEEACRRALLA
jgi:hypothetical protein